MAEKNGPVVVETRGLVKRYRVYPTPLSRLKEVACLNRRSFHREFTALEGIDLSIAKGCTIGALGRNGAGKSTLLKILAGIIAPTEGALRVEGRVSSIIELGAGFHPEFTGRENARLNAAVLGPDPDAGSETYRLFLRNIVLDMRQKTGQKCTAVRRVFVPADRMAEVRADLEEAFALLCQQVNTVSDGYDYVFERAGSSLRRLSPG